MDTDRLMTVEEVAQFLGVSRQTIYQWRYEGRGPSGYRVGGQVRYRRSELEAWLEQQADPQPAA